jgi:hypothetical protein
MSEAISFDFPASVAGISDCGEVYVFVGMFQGVVSEVEVYRTHADAAAAFMRFCGISYEDFAAGRAELSGKFEDSTIYACHIL